MNIINKGNNQVTAKFNFDFKSYKGFLKEVKLLAQKYEAKSNPEKLRYWTTLNGVAIPNTQCNGIGSRCTDMLHIGFIDSDNIQRWILEDEALMLQQKYDLPPWYLFSSYEEKKKSGEYYGRYYLINLMKQPLFNWMQIHQQTSSDTAHRIVTSRYSFRNCVLRFSKKGNAPKPKFVKVIGWDKDKVYSQPVSNAHLTYLNERFNLPKVKYSNKDKSLKLWHETYLTANVRGGKN